MFYYGGETWWYIYIYNPRNDYDDDDDDHHHHHPHPHPHAHRLPTSSTSSTASSSTSVAGRIVCDGNAEIRADSGCPIPQRHMQWKPVDSYGFFGGFKPSRCHCRWRRALSLSETMSWFKGKIHRNAIVLNSNIGGIHGITWVYPADFSFEPPGIKAQTKDLYLEMPISFMKPWVTLAISRPRSRSKHRPNVTCSIGMVI